MPPSRYVDSQSLFSVVIFMYYLIMTHVHSMTCILHILNNMKLQEVGPF